MTQNFYAIGDRRSQTVGDDYYVAPGARLIGSVILRAGASVWFNCVLRADDEIIEVGAGSNVQDGSIIHCDPDSPTIIGRDATIGHESLIGNGAIVLDRARIGRHCIVAAGSLVPPDREIPEGSVVMGAPAKIVRQVSAADLAMIAQAASHYQTRMLSYKRELRAMAPAAGGA